MRGTIHRGIARKTRPRVRPMPSRFSDWEREVACRRKGSIVVWIVATTFRLHPSAMLAASQSLVEEQPKDSDPGEDVHNREQFGSVRGWHEITETDGGHCHNTEVEAVDPAPVLEVMI